MTNEEYTRQCEAELVHLIRLYTADVPTHSSKLVWRVREALDEAYKLNIITEKPQYDGPRNIRVKLPGRVDQIAVNINLTRENLQ